MNRKLVISFIAIYCIAAGLGYFWSGKSHSDDRLVASYILQGKSTAAVVEAVESVKGQVTHEFRIINAVAATLTAEQRDDLTENPVILAINEDAPLTTAGGADIYADSIVTIVAASSAVVEL